MCVSTKGIIAACKFHPESMTEIEFRDSAKKDSGAKKDFNGDNHGVPMTMFYYYLVNYQSEKMRTTFSKLTCVNNFNIMCRMI